MPTTFFALARSYSPSAYAATLCVLIGLGGCGGSTATKPQDAAADRTGTATGGSSGAGLGGTTSTGGSSGGVGSGGTGGGSTGSGTGGASGTGTGGASSGTGGSSSGTGGSSSGSDAAADVPVVVDMGGTFPFDLPIPTDLTLADGAPVITACPADLSTATCADNTICLRQGPNGPEGCACANQKWFCPRDAFDGGTPPADANIPDAPGVAACAPGTATGGSCSAENEICAGGSNLGCACVQLLGGLRWFCI